MGKPRLPDVQTLISMGFDPGKVDKLLSYFKKVVKVDRVDALRKILRKNDRQQFVNRYRWDNLPNDLTGEYMERLLYYRYSGIFFYIKDLNKFNFLPFVGDGTIDEKGRYKLCTPLPFTGKSEQQEDKKEVYLPGLNFRPIYDITKTEPYSDIVVKRTVKGKEEIKVERKVVTVNPAIDGCVILNSYCKDLSQKAIPEQALIDPLLDMMAEVMPMARTNLLAHSGARGMRVNNQDEESNVIAANESLERAALNGEMYIPITAPQELQELGKEGSASGTDFFMYMQTLDNIRLQAYGLKNNGIFEKSEYINDAMAGNIQANVGQIYNDGLKLRQDFCDMVNAIWGIGISCSASETVTNSDTNFDGETLDDNVTQQKSEEEIDGNV